MFEQKFLLLLYRDRFFIRTRITYNEYVALIIAWGFRGVYPLDINLVGLHKY